MNYRTKTIADLLNIPRNTLIAWERRYRLVIPARTKNGYRIYSEENLAILRDLMNLVDRGHPIGQAVSIIKAQMSPADESTPDITDTRTALHNALLQFDRTRAEGVLNQLSAVSFSVLIREIFFPILWEVGEGWSNGTTSIVQEHFISSFVRDHMVAMFLRLGSGCSAGPSVICACYPDEDHELGLLGVSISLAQTGWRVTHLGAKVPVKALIDFVTDEHPRLLCISLLAHRKPGELDKYLHQLRGTIPDDVVIVLGGPGACSAQPDIPDVHMIGSYDHLVEISRQVA